MGGKKLLSRSSKSIDKSSKVSEWGWQSKCSWLFGYGRQYPCNQEHILQKRMSQLATYRGGGKRLPVELLPESGGARAPHLSAKRPTGNYDTKHQKIPGVGESHREREAGTQGRRWDQRQANPPGDDRDLGVGQER